MPREPFHVHLHHPPDADAMAHLCSLLDQRVEPSIGPELPEPARFELLVAGRLDQALLDASPDLSGVVIPWSGLPRPTRQLLLERPDLKVHNLHHNARPVAELAFALLLAAAKFVIPADRALRSGDWTPRYSPTRSVLLEGRRALVLGLGAIGRRLARMCLGLGMEVRGIRRRIDGPTREDGVDVFPATSLPELLPGTDILLICLPLTDRTDGLIGEAQLSALPPGALLVNVARGPVVDQEALYRALASRRLLGAGLDVWYRYPRDEAARTDTPPGDHPFQQLDNLVMSPHRGGFLASEEAERLRMEALATAINAGARGEPIPDPVDVHEGY